MARIAMLGTGLIGMFYTVALQGKRGRDQVTVVYGRDPERTKAFAEKHGVGRWTTDMADAIRDPGTDAVVIGLPNHLHKEAVALAAEAKKAVLCTKPLARNAVEAREMLEIVEKDGVTAFDERHDLIKRERMPDGRVELILKDRKSGEVVQRIEMP